MSGICRLIRAHACGSWCDPTTQGERASTSRRTLRCRVRLFYSAGVPPCRVGPVGPNCPLSPRSTGNPHLEFERGTSDRTACGSVFRKAACGLAQSRKAHPFKATSARKAQHEMCMNSEHLHQALANAPHGPPLKPTSVPTVITLEELLTRAQNRFRSAANPQLPVTFLQRFLRWLRGTG